MLEELAIRNYVIVDVQYIRFTPGFNVITGETGTGKSIIVDALSLLLGNRGGEDLIRKERQSALVEGLFSFPGCSPVDTWLREKGLEGELDTEVVLSRELTRQGKTRSRINGRTVTLSDLKEVGNLLLDVSSQGEHESFFLPRHRIALLDTFLDDEGWETHGKYRRHFNRYTELQRAIAAVDPPSAERIEELRHDWAELSSLGLTHDEYREVEEEFQMIADAQLLRDVLSELLSLLNGDDLEGRGVCSRIARVRSTLESLADTGEAYAHLSESLRVVEVEMQEIGYQVSALQEKLAFSTERLEHIEKTVSEIERLKRKHGCRTTEEFIALHETLKNELSREETQRAKKEELETYREEEKKQALSWGRKLSACRREAAARLGERLQQELGQLAFKRAECMVRFQPERDGEALLTPEGLDRVDFFISLNPGEPPAPVMEAASGGELSRIILGMKSIARVESGVGTIIFDEIDQGIGGKTAFWVGERLKRLSREQQVVCITHLPQIACFADHHLRVDKRFEEEHTWAEVFSLSEKAERVEELARMLGDEERQTPALQYAEKLIHTAAQGSWKKRHG